MRGAIVKTGFVFAVLVATTIIVGAGCSEKEVPFIVDEDEILKNLEQTTEGKELFRTASLFTETPYTRPRDEATYVDIVDSVRRNTFVVVSSDSILHRYPALNLTVRDAEVEVRDRFFVRTLRIHDGDTTVTSRERELERFGLFIKIGSDAQRYAGWKLFAYNGGEPKAPAELTVELDDGRTIAGDFRGHEPLQYLIFDTMTVSDNQGRLVDSIVVRERSTRHAYRRLDAILNVRGNTEMVIGGARVPDRSAFQLISAFTVDGYQTSMMHRPEAEQYVDSLRIHPDPILLWNLLFVQEFRESGTIQGLSYNAWCVPYRVP